MTAPDRPQAEAEIARELRLRPDPPRVMRLSRKAIALATALGGLGLGAILIVALQDRRGPDTRTELFSTERIPTARASPGCPAPMPTSPVSARRSPAISAAPPSRRRTVASPCPPAR